MQLPTLEKSFASFLGDAPKHRCGLPSRHEQASDTLAGNSDKLRAATRNRARNRALSVFQPLSACSATHKTQSSGH